MARVDTRWLLDYVELALIGLLGVGLVAGWRHYRRRVNEAAAEREALKVEQAELKSLLTTVVSEVRDGEGQQQHKPTLRVVRKGFAPVAALLSGAWAASRTHLYTVATTGTVLAVATYGFVHPVFDVPDIESNAPPVAAGPHPPGERRPRALPAPAAASAWAAPATTDTATSTPAPTEASIPTAPTATAAPRTTTAGHPPSAPPTTPSTTVAASPDPAPPVTVISGTPAGAAPEPASDVAPNQAVDSTTKIRPVPDTDETKAAGKAAKDAQPIQINRICTTTEPLLPVTICAG